MRVWTCFFRVCVVDFRWQDALPKESYQMLLKHDNMINKDWAPVTARHVDRQIVTDILEKRSASICKMLLTSWRGRTPTYSVLRSIRCNYCEIWGRHMGIGVKNGRDINTSTK